MTIDYTILQWSLLLVIPFFAYFVKGSTGFGPALVIMTIFSFFFSPLFALSFATVMDTIIGLVMVSTLRMTFENFKAALKILVFFAMGAISGGLILNYINSDVMTFMISFMVVVTALYFLLSSVNKNIFKSLNIPLNPMGFLGGISGVLTGMSGPPIILALAGRKDKASFREILTIFFIMGNLFRLLIYVGIDKYDNTTLPTLVMALPTSLAGLFLGYLLHNRISEKTFIQFTSLVLIATALLGFAKIF